MNPAKKAPISSFSTPPEAIALTAIFFKATRGKERLFSFSLSRRSRRQGLHPRCVFAADSKSVEKSMADDLRRRLVRHQAQADPKRIVLDRNEAGKLNFSLMSPLNDHRCLKSARRKRLLQTIPSLQKALITNLSFSHFA